MQVQLIAFCENLGIALSHNALEIPNHCRDAYHAPNWMFLRHDSDRFAVHALKVCLWYTRHSLYNMCV